MSLQSELPCWETIHGNRNQSCLLASDGEKACADLVRDDDARSFRICVDCLVYLLKKKGAPLSEKDFCSILNRRRVEGCREYEFILAHSLR